MATVGALATRFAPNAARQFVKLPKIAGSQGRVRRGLTYAANHPKSFQDASNTAWLVGSAPGAAASLSGARQLGREIDVSERKMRDDGSLRARPLKKPEQPSLFGKAAFPSGKPLRELATGVAPRLGGAVRKPNGGVTQRRPTFVRTVRRRVEW